MDKRELRSDLRNPSRDDALQRVMWALRDVASGNRNARELTDLLPTIEEAMKQPSQFDLKNYYRIGIAWAAIIGFAVGFIVG